MIGKIKSRISGGVVATLVVTLALAGCDEQITLNEAARDTSDSCNVYHNAISEARRTEINQQASNAAAGAVFGALVGAALSSSNDRAKGALIGATAGGLAGYSGTYYRQKAANAADARTLLASVNSDANSEATLISRTGQSVAQLRRCRDAQVTALSSGVRSGKIGKDAGRAQLATLKTRIATDNKIISASFNGIGERVDGYIDASAAGAQVDRAAYLAARDQAARQARTATPGVVAANSALGSQKTADDRLRTSLEANVQAVEKLLG